VVERSRVMMERQVKQLADLMDLSRISRVKIVLQKTRMRLAAAGRDAIDTSRPLIERKCQDLTLDGPDEPVFVDGDGTRLTQVFTNLLNNAAKYTQPGGRIRLVVESQGSEVVVTVEDTGVGIPAHMLPRVFDLFTQEESSLGRSQGGLGLGLPLVRVLAFLHRGTIQVRSEGLDKGSEFTVRLLLISDRQADQASASAG